MSTRQRFKELPKKLQAQILSKHRDINTDFHDWWDCVYENFKASMEDVGVEVERMYFSGFWSQGDGACFEGKVSDWPQFLKSLGHTESALISHADLHFHFSVNHSGHYYHEKCTQFSSDLPLPESADDKDFAYGYLTYEADSIHEATAMALLNQYSADSLEREFIEAFRDHMRDLYKLLEEEYDHLTSDEAVLDALEANDLLEDEINYATEVCHA